MRGFPSLVCIAAVLSAALLVAGCGGSGGSNPSVTVKSGSLSKAQFIKEANAICAKREKAAARALLKYLTAHKLEPTTHDILTHASEVAVVVAPTFQQEIEEIRTLGAPAGEAERVSAFLTALQWNVDESKAEAEKFVAREGRFSIPTKLASRYGMTECAKG